MRYRLLSPWNHRLRGQTAGNTDEGGCKFPTLDSAVGVASSAEGSFPRISASLILSAAFGTARSCSHARALGRGTPMTAAHSVSMNRSSVRRWRRKSPSVLTATGKLFRRGEWPPSGGLLTLMQRCAIPNSAIPQERENMQAAADSTNGRDGRLIQVSESMREKVGQAVGLTCLAKRRKGRPDQTHTAADFSGSTPSS